MTRGRSGGQQQVRKMDTVWKMSTPGRESMCRYNCVPGRCHLFFSFFYSVMFYSIISSFFFSFWSSSGKKWRPVFFGDVWLIFQIHTQRRNDNHLLCVSGVCTIQWIPPYKHRNNKWRHVCCCCCCWLLLFFFLSLLLLLLSQFQSSSEKTRRKDEASRAWTWITRWPSDVWSISKHLSLAAATQLKYFVL